MSGSRLSAIASHAPFAGATVVVTRPASSAATLTRRIRLLRGAPIRLPGLSLRAATEEMLASARTRVGGLDGLIFTSPAAVRYALAGASSLPIPEQAFLCAIGTSTQRALARHGLASVAPQRADSEGLLALPELAQVHGRRIGLVGAPGGRDLIETTLRARGADIEPIHVYQRVPPRWTQRTLDRLALAPDPLLTLISSGETLNHLVARLPTAALARLRAQILVVSSDRLAALARAHAFEEVRVAASALPADLLEAARKALARHRL